MIEPSKSPRVMAALAVVSGVFLFGHSALAVEHYQGWPCTVGVECTLHRMPGLELPSGNSFRVDIHQDGPLGSPVMASACSVGSDPDGLGTFVFTFDAATSGTRYIDLFTFTSANCTTGGTLWENSTTGTVTIVEGEPEPEAPDLGQALANVIPTWSWVEATGTGNGTATTTIEDHLGAALGSATGVFPMCITYSWAQLMDAFVGLTDGTVTPQKLRTSSPFATGTNLTIDLSNNLVTSDTHFQATVSELQIFFLAFMWLVFGVFVIWDRFFRGAPSEG